MARSRGRRPNPQPRAITAAPARQTAVVAAAAPISLDGTGWKSWKLGDQRWQEEAWRQFDICGELRFATNWMASAISRCRLYVAELDKYGRPSKECEDEEIQILSESMFGGPSLKAEAQRSIGAQLYVSGESFIVAEDVARASKDVWYVCSSSEVHRTGTTQIEVMRSHLYGGGRHTLRQGKDLMIRVWTPHPRRYDAPDSSVRSVLPVLREIEQLTKKVFAQIDSRLAGAGLLFVPTEMELPPTKDGLVGAAGLARRIERAIAASLQDQASASSLAPIIVQVAGELVDKVKWQTFETPFQAETAEKLTAAIRRLATGLDIPPEILLGQGDSNHWSAWQIEESTIKIQVEPSLIRICDALTNGYLKAALKVLGKDPEQYVVWYDTAPLAVRPNRQADAITLYGLAPDMISAEEVRKAGDWGEGAAPKKKEYERRLAEDLVKLNPALIYEEDIQKALGIKWTLQDPNAAPPEEMAPEEEAPAIEGDGWGPPSTFPDEDTGTPAQEAALLTGSDYIVRRALERAGARLLTRSRRTSGEFASVPAMEVHTRVAIPAEEIDRLIGDAFTGVPELAERVGMEPDVLTDMLTVYTTALLVRSTEHDYALFAAYVDQSLDLIGHGRCSEFCRNPLHPGPCKGWRRTPERADEGGRTEPVAGPGRPRKKAAKKQRDIVVSDKVRQGPQLPPAKEPEQAATVLDPAKAAQAPADLRAAVDGDEAARQRIIELAQDTYTFVDPDSGMQVVVDRVGPSTRSPRGSGVVIDCRVLDAQGNTVGHIKRSWRSDPSNGELVARHASMDLQPHAQGGGFSRRFNARAYQAYKEMGVPHVTLTANDTVGGAAWALEGYDFIHEEDMREISDKFRRVSRQLQPGPIKEQIDALLVRSTSSDWQNGTHPSPYEFAMVGAEFPRPRTIRGGREVQMWTGKEVMMDSIWEGVRSISEPYRPGSRPEGLTAAAAAGAEDAWVERAEFLQAVTEHDHEYADEVAEAVPSNPEDVEVREGHKDDYAEHHHMVSADANQTDLYLQGAIDLLTDWGRDDAGAMTAHAGCASGAYCRAPLHPGPCRGWRNRLRDKDPDRARELEQAERDRRAAKKVAKKAPPAKAVAEPAKKATAPAAPAAPINANNPIERRARANGNVQIRRLLPGDRIKVRQNNDGTWTAGRAQRDKSITVDEVRETYRGGRVGWRMTGHDEDGNQVVIDTTAVQTFLPDRDQTPFPQDVPPPPPPSPAASAASGRVLTPEAAERIAADIAILAQGGRSRGSSGPPASEVQRRAARDRLHATMKVIYEIDDPGSGLRSEVVDASDQWGEFSIGVRIFDANGRTVGTSTRRWRADGKSVYNAYLQISSDVQGGGFAARYNDRAFRAYAEAGVHHVDVHANIDVGGYTWATQGFDFHTNSDLQTFVQRFHTARMSASRAAGDPNGGNVYGQQVTQEEARRLVSEIEALLSRSTPSHFRMGTHPTPYEFSQLGSWLPHQVPAPTRADPTRTITKWMGKSTLLGSSWHGRKPITKPVRRGGTAPYKVPRKRAAKKAPAKVTAASLFYASEAVDAAIAVEWDERFDFLTAVAATYLEYANEFAQAVPAVPEDATPDAEGETNYAEFHHLISADETIAAAGIADALELLAEWGRGGEEIDEEEPDALVAHAGCSAFCRNPLHPGPCKGWRRQKDVAPADRRDKEPEPRPRTRAKKAPAKAARAPRELDEEGARERQALIDAARPYGRLLAAVDQIMNDTEGLPSVAILNNRLSNSGLSPEEQTSLRTAVDNPLAFVDMLRDLAASKGVHREGAAGELVAFDPARHESITGDAVTPGTDMAVVKPGVTLEIPGEGVVLLDKAVVEVPDEWTRSSIERARHRDEVARRRRREEKDRGDRPEGESTVPTGERGADGYTPGPVGRNLGTPENLHPTMTAVRAQISAWRQLEEGSSVGGIRYDEESGQWVSTHPDQPRLPNVGDRRSAAMADQQGFSAPPIVVSDAELDAAVAAGGVQFWRGTGGGSGPPDYIEVPATDIIEQLRTGPAYQGFGVYGNGIYGGDNHRIAREYAGGHRFGESAAVREGAVVRMVLRPGSRVIEYSDARREQQQWIQRTLDDALARRLTSEEMSDVRQDVAGATSNLGVWAAMMGYDAIYADEARYVRSRGDDSRHWNILNRGALLISDQTETVSRGETG